MACCCLLIDAVVTIALPSAKLLLAQAGRVKTPVAVASREVMVKGIMTPITISAPVANTTGLTRPVKFVVGHRKIKPGITSTKSESRDAFRSLI